MPASKTVTLTINLIETKWEYDADHTLEDQEPECMILRKPCSYSREYAQEVDPEATVAALMEIGGCTEEQARQQAASIIDRFIEWQKGNYIFLGCIATAYAVITDREGNETDKIEVASESVWGIEQDCGDYAKEVEGDLISQLLSACQKCGYELTEEEWDAVPREEARDSYSTYPETTASTRPLDPLFVYSGYNSTYAYDGESVIVQVTCNECGASRGDSHESWCEFHPDNSEDQDEDQDQEDELAADFLTTKEYGL